MTRQHARWVQQQAAGRQQLVWCSSSVAMRSRLAAGCTAAVDAALLLAVVVIAAETLWLTVRQRPRCDMLQLAAAVQTSSSCSHSANSNRQSNRWQIQASCRRCRRQREQQSQRLVVWWLQLAHRLLSKHSSTSGTSVFPASTCLTLVCPLGLLWLLSLACLLAGRRVPG